MNALEIKNVTKTFGKVVANNNINLTLNKGEILAILGENGSGKTTLMNMISGIYHPDAGEILVNENPVVINSPKDAFSLGIGMIHQHFKLVDVFTATENIVLGIEDQKGFNLKTAANDILSISHKYGFEISPQKKIYQMSVSEKQTVEIIKVLYRGADILILDEPTAVLTPQETQKLFGVLRNMKEDGKSIIIITHKLNEVMEISDRVAVLRKGEYAGTVETANTNESQLTEMMVGRKVSLNIDRSEPHNQVERLVTVFSNDDSYYVTFTDVSGLSSSSPVYANGYKVGVVKDIIYDYSPQGKIVAVMGLDKNMRVPQGTRAEIASDLLGNIKVNLVLGSDPLHMLASGDTISGGAEEGVMSKLSAMMPAIEAIVPKLDSIMTSLNILLADPALRNTLHNVEGMTGNLNATSQNLRALSASLNRDVPGMMTKANGVLDNTQQLTQNLSQVDVVALTESVNKTLENVEQMTKKLNSNEGTLGLLMRDATLYNNLSSTAASADSLLIDFKAHPKRYIHFSVFGKSDKQK